MEFLYQRLKNWIINPKLKGDDCKSSPATANLRTYPEERVSHRHKVMEFLYPRLKDWIINPKLKGDDCKSSPATANLWTYPEERVKWGQPPFILL
jgi:hypothetical protein